MGLNEEIKSGRAIIHSDGYPMSIGELTNLYRDGELDIHPEFQRFYRWNQVQKSRLIESILLGIPLPSIFASQQEGGQWDIVDGLQRLSTIFELMGILKDEHGKVCPQLTLTKTRYLPSLQGKKWKDQENPTNEIGETNQLLVKRAKIDVKIILRESSEQAKYELFQRLNTGGSQLSEQELRNVLLIMVNREFYQWVRELATDHNFHLCIGLSENAGLQQYDVDLVMRFLVLRTQEEKRLKGIGDMGEYLNDESIELAQKVNYDKRNEKAAFEFAFSELAKTLNEDSFRPFDVTKNKYAGGFLLSAFEVLALGLGYNYENCKAKNAMPNIKKISRTLWSNAEFLKYSGSGVRASSRIPHTIPLGRSLMKP
ncbi:MAG: DUF262 domain-containing protein [Dehalococcoidia bacterium]|nr:DUF262 domain-containing protein [Dehalococcoidia bacterium]